MNVFTKRAIVEARADFPDASAELSAWYGIVSQAIWKNFVELRVNFPKADDVDGGVVFNIRHNRYRLLAAIKYAREIRGKHVNGSVYVKAFMTHAVYQRWSALSRKNREEALYGSAG